MHLDHIPVGLGGTLVLDAVDTGDVIVVIDRSAVIARGGLVHLETPLEILILVFAAVLLRSSGRRTGAALGRIFMPSADTHLTETTPTVEPIEVVFRHDGVNILTVGQTPSLGNGLVFNGVPIVLNVVRHPVIQPDTLTAAASGLFKEKP